MHASVSNHAELWTSRMRRALLSRPGESDGATEYEAQAAPNRFGGTGVGRRI